MRHAEAQVPLTKRPCARNARTKRYEPLRRILWCAIAFAAFSLTGCATLGKEGPIRVRGVINGATFEVMRQDKYETVRIRNLLVEDTDAPAGILAYNALREMISDREVILEYRLFKRRTNDAGERVADVFLNGVDVGEEMVRQGVAFYPVGTWESFREGAGTTGEYAGGGALTAILVGGYLFIVSGAWTLLFM